MKKIILLLIFQITLPCTNLLAARWYTQQAGFWDQNSTWMGGIAPTNFPNDSIFIRHAVAITHNLYLGSNCYFEIEAGGGICGHHSMHVPSGSKLIKYGLLELDTLNIPGGNVMCLPPGNVILTFNGFLSNGGTMSITCGFQVGPWFQCSLPEYGYLNLNELEAVELPFKILSNPAHETLRILLEQNPKNLDSIRLYDITGKTIKSINELTTSLTINIGDIKPSIYFIQFCINEKIFRQKIIIE